MALLHIITVPDPRLSKPARPVRPDEFGAALDQKTRDMAETMYAAPGVGLAAPQVADLRRFLVADPAQEEEGQRRGASFVVMVNPEITERSKETSRFEEGCLSVPDFWEKFERPNTVRIQWQDALGNPHEQVFEGYAAVVVQHEIDHLDGVTILDKVSRFRRSRYLRARQKSQKKESRS